jgi:hypothetical protein
MPSSPSKTAQPTCKRELSQTTAVALREPRGLARYRRGASRPTHIVGEGPTTVALGSANLTLAGRHGKEDIWTVFQAKERAPRAVGARSAWLVATVDTHGGIVRLEDYAGEAAAAHDRAPLASAPPPAPSAVTHLVPFLPLADVERSIAWLRTARLRTTGTAPRDAPHRPRRLLPDGRLNRRRDDHRPLAAARRTWAHSS